MLKVYVARAMTGCVKENVVREATDDKLFLESHGLIVLDPVSEEGIKPTADILKSQKSLMDIYWPRDKKLIREAHAVIIMSPHVPSLGCIREYGYARYHLWKKTITIFPAYKQPQEGAICYYEDDFVTTNLSQAVDDLKRTHGTWFKRFKWRLDLYRRCWVKSVYYRIKEWF